MATPIHNNENDALEAVKRLHRGYSGVASKLLIAHVVSGTIEILDAAKSMKLKTEEQRLRSALIGKDIGTQRHRIASEITKIASEIGIKPESEIKQDIKTLETIDEPIISASSDLIVQLVSLKRTAKTPRAPKPVPVVPPPLTPIHTLPVGPNIIGNTHITIHTLPHSESITGTVQIGETLELSKDGINWSSVPVDARGNFIIPITENTNGSYTYALKTKNGAGESPSESISIVIAATPANAPTGPTITSHTTFAVDTPTIEGSTTPGSDIEISVGGTVVGTGKADIHGDYSVTTSTIPDGAHTVTVKSINPVYTSNVSRNTTRITVNNIHSQELAAIRAVEATEPPHTPTQSLHDAANSLVTALPTTSTVRSSLITRLSAAQAAINALPRPLTAADLRSFTVSSLEVEQGTTNPKIKIQNLTTGTQITILDKKGNQISDSFEVLPGITEEDFELFINTAYPWEENIQIKVEDIHGSLPTYVDRTRKLKVGPQKINLSGTTSSLSFTSQMDADGRVPFGTKIGIAINNIPKGAGLRITSPVSRLPGTTSYDLGNYRTDTGKYSGELDMIDTKKAPFNTSEDLIIEMYDPNYPTVPAVSIRTVNFELAQKEASLNLTTVNPPTGKIKNGDQIIFGIGRPNRDTKIIVQPGGAEYDMLSSPTDIRLPGTTTPGKHKYAFYLQDKNHLSKPAEPIGNHEIEVDHEEIMLVPPIVPGTPLIATQPVTRPTVNVSGLLIGSEVTLTGPHGELAKFIAKSTSVTLPLNKLDITNSDPQNITVTVTDPHHPHINAESSVFQVDVKKKVEAPKHLPQPVFRTPLDYAEGGGDIDIELLNAVSHSEVTIEYATAGGGTTTTPALTITADGGIKIPLPGFEAPAGTSNVTVTYRNPVSGISQARTISMHVNPRPAIERPEGFQDEVDITTKPTQVKVGKIKPGQTISVQHSDGSSPPLSRGTDGTYTFPMPATMCSQKNIYTVTISDTTGASENFPLTVNVKVPPKANLRIDYHNFIHACEDAKKHGTGNYRINGKPLPFTVKKSWGKYKTSYHGENFSAKTPEDLYKAVKGHLDHHNQHEKDEYNAYWGLMPETPEHGKIDDHKPGKEGGDEKHEKGVNSEGHENKGGSGKFVGAVKTVLKTAAWPVGGAISSLAYLGTYGIGTVTVGPALVAGAVVGGAALLLWKLWRIKNPKKGGEDKAHP